MQPVVCQLCVKPQLSWKYSYKRCQYIALHLSIIHHTPLISDHTFCFPEEVMLAEENKNPGPSALDGKRFFTFPSFTEYIHYLSSSLILLYIQFQF